MDSFTANLQKREIPSLYGLRGIAALFVVFAHYSNGTPVVKYFPAGYAVSLFFILSGLLITWLLLKEHDKTGAINFRQFYIRRSLRLFPVLYATWVIALFTLESFPSKWAVFFYVCDYYQALGGAFDPMTLAWSLGVEEKFYLLWPLLLHTMNRARLYYVVPAIVVLDQIYREVLSRTGHGIYAAFAFDTNLDCVLIGCYIALLAHRGTRFPKWMGNPLIPFATIVSLYTCEGLVVHYLLALTLIWAVMKSPKILNNSVAKYFGLISYSLYLCHILASYTLWPHLFGQVHFSRWSFQFASKVAVAILCATALHYGIERPFLKLKDRFHKRASLRVGEMVTS